ncbi:MAG: glycosyltransferase [Mesorhizobium sp.]
MVFNKVDGDSRVIKTAQAAINAGHDATIVGVTSQPAVERAEVEGVPVVLIPNFSIQLKRMGIWGGKHRDLRLLISGYLKSAIPEIIALEPDLLHSHDMIGLKIGASSANAFVAGGRQVPWVHDLHEFVAGLKGELAESYMPICLGWEREFLHTADHLFTVSDALAQEVKQRYYLKSAPTVVYNTPRLDAFRSEGPEIRATLGLGDDPLVVFVGGATALRGCETIVEATSKLDGVHLAMVSQGVYVDELRQKAAELGMAERFHTHPYVLSDQVSSFIRTADVGIHGLVHYPNAEVAMPNKMFEYLHAGIPLAMSDVVSMKAFVEKNGVGMAFKAEDPVSCAEVIQKLLYNKSRFTRKNTKRLRSQYSWEEQERKIQEVYARLLGRPARQPSAADRSQAASWEKIETIMFESIYARTIAEASATFLKSSAKAASKPQLIPIKPESASVPKKNSIRKKAKSFVKVARKQGFGSAIKITFNKVFSA